MLNVDKISKRTAEILIESGAVLFNFEKRWTFVSGIISPIYCDCRLLISNVERRNEIVAFMQETIADIVSENEDFIIAAVATGGIPYGSMLADRMSKRMIYIRLERKGHGKRSKIEGKYKPSDRAILIEDLITTGESSLGAARDLKSKGVNILACLSIMNYGLLQTIDTFDSYNVKQVSLTNFDVLSSISMDKDKISPSEYNELKKWREIINRQLIEGQHMFAQFANAG